MLHPSRTQLVWLALLAGTSLVFSAAVLTPFFPAEVQAAVRWAFAPACHQLPARSLHLGGAPMAICDRCTGIYLGVVLGVAGTGWGRSGWKALGWYSRYVLLGAAVPLGLDWVGPVVGLWANGPYSRAITGLVFGVVAASFVTDRILRRVRKEVSEGRAASAT